MLSLRLSTARSQRPHQRLSRLRTTAATNSSKPREPWSFSRFARTILHFNPLPSPLDVATAPLRLLRILPPKPPMAAALPTQPSAANLVLLDPSDASALAAWGALDDTVMGGVSESGIRAVAGAGEGGSPAAVFSGRISTANNGGFASVRNRNFEPAADCEATDGLEVRVRGDGQRYKIFVRTDSGWDAIGYGAGFDTADGTWLSVRLPWESFKPIFRARTVPNAPPLERGRVRSLQLMLSKFESDGALNQRFKGDGEFRVDVARISTYKE
jgi:hypothetical protein